MSADAQGSEAALRISLLWDELQSKLETSPNAALGLLDIANSRPTRNVEAVRALEPALARSARQATITMPTKDAWQFLVAMTDKLRDQRLADSVTKSIRGAAVDLAAAHPADTVAILPSLMNAGQRELLTGAAGDGIAHALNRDVSNHLPDLDDLSLLELVMASPPLMESVLTSYPEFSGSLSIAIEGVRAEAQRLMLRLVVDDRHIDLARVLFADLDTSMLAQEVRHLHEANGLAAAGLRDLIVQRAEQAGGIIEVRDAAAEFGEDTGAAALVQMLIKPNSEDIRWLLFAPQVSAARRFAMIADLVRRASRDQLRTMLADEVTLRSTLDALLRHAPTTVDALLRS